ncbi:MAG TPA: hypothetical protein V6D17_13200 [Candidatus Obscuribacterales bacterium]
MAKIEHLQEGDEEGVKIASANVPGSDYQKGMQELVNEQQQALERLKAGEPSGITGDFDKPILVAEGREVTPQFKLGATEFDELADQNGVVPFGDKLSGNASQSKMKSQGYFSATLGFEGYINGGQAHRDVMNVNLGDQLEVKGQKLIEGKQIRTVFPIKHQQVDAHWNWIDATIQLKQNGMVDMAVNRISASEKQPKWDDDSPWDQVNLHYTLPYYSTPQHVAAADYFGYMDGEARQQQEWMRRTHFRPVRIDER